MLPITVPANPTRWRMHASAALSPVIAGTVIVGTVIVGMAACGPDSGIVEYHWALSASDGAQIFPNGNRKNTCSLAGLSTSGVATTFALQPEIRLYECLETDEPTVCLQRTPTITSRLDCDRSRDALLDVPAQQDTYVVDIVGIATTFDGVQLELPPTCLARPSARRVRVTQGRVTDLAVYSFRLATTSGQPLDLRTCQALRLDKTPD